MAEQAPNPPGEPGRMYSGYAVTSLILALFSPVLSILTAAPAVFFGVKALLVISRSGGLLKGRIVASVGIVLALLYLSLAGVFFGRLILEGKEPANRAACMNNLDFLHLVLQTLAETHPDKLYPPLSPKKGMLMFHADDRFVLEYVDAALLRCPIDRKADPSTPDPGVLNDRSYIYLGYILENEAQLQLLADAYKEPEFNPEADIRVPAGQGNAGGDIIYRLREHIEPIFGTESAKTMASRIPVLMNRVTLLPQELYSNHKPHGSHVLFLNGDIRFMPCGDTFPMSDSALTILTRLGFNLAPAGDHASPNPD